MFPKIVNFVKTLFAKKPGCAKVTCFCATDNEFPQELRTVRFNLEPKRCKSVSLSAKRSVSDGETAFSVKLNILFAFSVPISGKVQCLYCYTRHGGGAQAGGFGEEAQAVTDRPWGACVADKMFTLLRMYADDNIASMYATSMHSDSGYLVTDASVRARVRRASVFDEQVPTGTRTRR